MERILRFRFCFQRPPVWKLLPLRFAFPQLPAFRLLPEKFGGLYQWKYFLSLSEYLPARSPGGPLLCFLPPKRFPSLLLALREPPLPSLPAPPQSYPLTSFFEYRLFLLPQIDFPKPLLPNFQSHSLFPGQSPPLPPHFPPPL